MNSLQLFTGYFHWRELSTSCQLLMLVLLLFLLVSCWNCIYHLSALLTDLSSGSCCRSMIWGFVDFCLISKMAKLMPFLQVGPQVVSIWTRHPHTKAESYSMRSKEHHSLDNSFCVLMRVCVCVLALRLKFLN